MRNQASFQNRQMWGQNWYHLCDMVNRSHIIKNIIPFKGQEILRDYTAANKKCLSGIRIRVRVRLGKKLP